MAYSWRMTFLVAVLLAGTSTAFASVNHGNFGPASGGNVVYQNVTESSNTDPVPPPRYGAPTITANTLDFNPSQFGANSSAGATDITDIQLNFTVQTTSPDLGISMLNLFESGDYSLIGTGTALTSATAGVIIRVTVTALDGSAVAPIVLAPVNASFSDALPGTEIVTPWSLSASINIAAQLASLAPGQNATRIDVVIDNLLVTTSQTNTASIINKKEFIIDTDVVPEPASLGLLGLGVVAMLRRRRAA